MKSILLSRDGKYLVSMGDYIKVFDAQSQKLLGHFRHYGSHNIEGLFFVYWMSSFNVC